MDELKYKDDLKDIKDIMNRSSRFISLSGLSGISAGIIALIGAYIAYQTVYSKQVSLGYSRAILANQSITTLLIIAILTIALTIGAGIFFTSRKAKENKEKLWDIHPKRLLINLLIPLATGGILGLMFLLKGYIGIVAPLTLIFYGLALVNASKYTLSEIRSLGIIEIIIGLIAFQFIGYGLLFWSIGFGLLHILYGIAMHIKYK
jgi:predicted lysophospholipase L1 biosynthesis ABC-type transport system permease subunit